MKKLYFVLLAFVVASCCSSCNSHPRVANDSQIVVNESPTIPDVGQNLDLRAVGEIIRTSRSPQEIEQKLNEPNGINNLDLDGDGAPDFLSVKEYPQGNNIVYSICANLSDGSPEVANVVVNPATKQFAMNGNTAYYGTNNYYESGFSASDAFLLGYLMAPRHGFYVSPYRYGYYGYGYTTTRRVVPYTTYYSRPVMTPVRTTRAYAVPKTRTYSSVKTPNSNNTSSIATKRTSNFSNPTSTQKSFKVRDNSTPTRSGGFGTKSSSSSSYSKPASSSSSYSKPASSYSKPSSTSRSSGFGSSRSSGSRSSSRHR